MVIKGTNRFEVRMEPVTLWTVPGCWHPRCDLTGVNR